MSMIIDVLNLLSTSKTLEWLPLPVPVALHTLRSRHSFNAKGVLLDPIRSVVSSSDPDPRQDSTLSTKKTYIIYNLYFKVDQFVFDYKVLFYIEVFKNAL